MFFIDIEIIRYRERKTQQNNKAKGKFRKLNFPFLYGKFCIAR